MLSLISIQNFLLFQEIEIDCSRGLNVLTGETGAGKSIIIDAIQLAFGAKATADLILHNQSSATIMLVFSIHQQHHRRTLALLEENHIPFDDEIIIRREIPLSGRSRVRVNDILVSIPLLERLKETLLVIQGQFDPFGLLSTSKHRQLLDTSAKINVQQTQECYQNWLQKRRLLNEHLTTMKEQQQNSELLHSYLQELDKMNPQEKEWEGLEERLPFLKKSANLIEKMSQAHTLLNEEALPAIERAMRLLDALLIAGSQAEISELISTGKEDLIAGIELLQNKAQELLIEIEQLPELEDRLYDLREIARKHRINGSDIVRFHENLRTQVLSLDGSEEKTTSLQEAAKQAKDAYINASKELRDAREKAAAKLQAMITAELSELAMGKCVFKVAITPLEEKNWSINGTEDIAFLLSTTPNREPAPLANVASGGELNRLLLAIQSTLATLAGSLDSTTIIFDEIDSGIGGKTAAILGKRLKKLSSHAQIIAITHAPQVAACADTHFLIEKNSQNTLTTIRQLQHTERTEDIARMISGTKVNQSARSAAQQLIDDAQKN